jgi:D-alanyl-D-alanine dipeptidase
MKADDDQLSEVTSHPVDEAQSELQAIPVIDHYGEHLDDLIRIPIEDNGEPLVDIFKVCPQLKWAPASPRFNFPRSGLARVSVAEMLKRAENALPAGYHFQIIGAFRAFEVQRQMYERAKGELRAKHPDWSEELLTDYINVFSAPPVHETPPPHTTGGAVDLGIIDESGERLDMISPFEMGWDSAPTNIEGLNPQARKNRDFMIKVLLDAGLNNFPGEWWHWSYGEPGWSLRVNHPVALYGAVPEDKIPDWSPPLD